jgi:3-phenylpropionate/cinnamic acid dioxygenase small subunit
MAKVVLHYELERFLIMEADLLDRRDFDAWLDLLDDDLHYVIPNQAIAVAETDSRSVGFTHANSFLDETKVALERRIRRMALPNAWSEHPPPRTCRFVSNVRVTSMPDEVFAVASSLLVYRSRLANDGRLIAGARRDRIRRTDGPSGWRLLRREVQVLDAVIEANHLSVIF